VNFNQLFYVPALGHSKSGDVAQFIITRGASVNILLHYLHELLLQPFRERFLNTILWMGILKVLLENGESVNERTRGNTLLMAAAGRRNSVDVLQLLLDQGADIKAKDDKGNTALMEAVRADSHRNAEVLIKFHQAKQLSLIVQNHEGMTTLMFAININCPEKVKQLIDCTGDVNVCDVKGNTALLHAVEKGTRLKTEVLTTLIRAGSDVNCQNNEDVTPLMLASKNCWIPIIISLLDSGADVNAVSKKNRTKTALSFLSASSITVET
jgi:ankyrin repeat protein